jgi:hypothetical protein
VRGGGDGGGSGVFARMIIRPVASMAMLPLASNAGSAAEWTGFAGGNCEHFSLCRPNALAEMPQPRSITRRGAPRLIAASIARLSAWPHTPQGRPGGRVAGRAAGSPALTLTVEPPTRAYTPVLSADAKMVALVLSSGPSRARTLIARSCVEPRGGTALFASVRSDPRTSAALRVTRRRISPLFRAVERRNGACVRRWLG